MYKYLLSVLLIASFTSCDKKNEAEINVVEVTDKKVTMKVRVFPKQPPNVSNRYWTIGLELDKKVINLSGTLNFKFDVYSEGQLVETIEYVADFTIKDSNTFEQMTSNYANYPQTEVKNMQILSYKQASGIYEVTVTK